MFRDDLERFTRAFESDLRRLQGEFGELIGSFRDPRRTVYPPVNMYAGDDAAVVTAEVPGVSPGGVDVSVLGEELTLSGKRPGDSPPEGSYYQLRERVEGDFHRTVRLPFRIDAAAVTARFEDGVLTVTLPRESKERPQRVRVAVGS